MFERITLRRSVDGPAITAGELAEAMLFYQSVHLVLDPGSLSELVQSVGMPTLLRCLSLPGVNATYIESQTGTRTDRTPSGPEYSLISFRLAGHEGVGQLKTKKQRLEYMLESRGYKRSDARSYAERFRRLVRYRSLTDDYYLPGGVLRIAQQDLQDPQFVRPAALIVAESLLGRKLLAQEFQFDVRQCGDKFRVVSNLNFEEISRVQQQRDANAGEYTAAHITSELLTASIDTVFAGHYGSDYYTSSTASRIIQLREQHLLRRIGKNQEELEKFKELVLDGSPDIEDTINRGDRAFEEFLELLKSASKFKKWLQRQSADESLMSTYLEDITSVGWLGSIKGKVLRLLTGTAIGAVEPISGLAISVGDSFLLDRLAGGWRPSHFVSRRLRPFVDGDDKE